MVPKMVPMKAKESATAAAEALGYEFGFRRGSVVRIPTAVAEFVRWLASRRDGRTTAPAVCDLRSAL